MFYWFPLQVSQQWSLFLCESVFWLLSEYRVWDQPCLPIQSKVKLRNMNKTSCWTLRLVCDYFCTFWTRGGNNSSNNNNLNMGMGVVIEKLSERDCRYFKFLQIPTAIHIFKTWLQNIFLWIPLLLFKYCCSVPISLEANHWAEERNIAASPWALQPLALAW